ncbi:hypothetical protein POM88_007713 [Heracleum sosnowskyi]|uniref:C2H2-type domain-containing protein n=1 Tax=Heracleum sosnowskyi TaxID=360622 RepID=A0AAD8J4Y0_9APIA|nr:hypothetical protein POM88_007713 [Heracleum sosnowskyi]
MESDSEQDYNHNNNNQGHHNKFLIKLKMPMGSKQDLSADHNQEAAGEENNPTHHHITNNTPRACPQCKRGFGSGKALGGHMRIHAKDIKKKQNKNKRPVCTICGRNFPSMKSLFGHMRSHPERQWRGIQPPLEFFHENNYNFPSSEDDDDDGDFGSGSGGGHAVPVVNLLASMPKWGEKAKRGRKEIKKNSGVMLSEEEDDEDEDETEDEEEEEKLRNAVNDLMLLKQVDCSESSGVSTLAAAAIAAQNSRAMNAGLDQHQEVSYSNSLTFNNRGEELGDVKFQGSKKEMKGSFGIVDDECHDHLVMEKLGIEQGGSNDHVMKNISDHNMGQEVNAAQHVVENHNVDDESDSRRTELLVMNNGGHKYFNWGNRKDDDVEMATGSKIKKAKKMKLMMDLDQEKPSAGGGSVQAAASVSTTVEKYKCTTCNKSFSSHQALGGHRSSHNKFKLTIINADSGINNNQPHQSSSHVNAFAASDHRRAGNEEFDQNHHQLISSPDKVNRVMSEDCATKKDSNNEGAGSSKGDHSSSTIHQCEVCNKIFPSGQALGGHKRCHWTASADQTDSQPQAQAPLGMTSSGEEASTQTGGARIQNIAIDLNFPPPMDDDGEAQGGGAVADDEHATRLYL